MSNISLQTHHFDRIMIIVISLYQCKKNSIHAYSAYITMYMFMLLYIKKTTNTSRHKPFQRSSWSATIEIFHAEVRLPPPKTLWRHVQLGPATNIRSAPSLGEYNETMSFQVDFPGYKMVVRMWLFQKTWLNKCVWGRIFLKQILDILHLIYTHPEKQSTPEW